MSVHTATMQTILSLVSALPDNGTRTMGQQSEKDKTPEITELLALKRLFVKKQPFANPLDSNSLI